MHRTRLMVPFMIMLVFFLLAGCNESKGTDNASSATNTPGSIGSLSNGKFTTLRYMIWNSSYIVTYQKMFAEFNKQNPYIKVDLQVVPWGNYWDKLMNEIAGGNAPDIFWGYIPRFPGFIDKGAVLDITDYINKDKIDLSKYNPAMVQAYTVNGKNYSVPQNFGVMGIIYNQDLLKKAGIDQYPSDLQWNPNDGGTFVEFLQKLTLDKNGKHPNEAGFDSKNIVQYGFNLIDKDQVDPGQLIGLIASNGGTMMKDSKLALDGKLAETYRFVYDLTFKYHVAPTYADIHTGGSESKFVSGQIAVWMNGQWMMKPLKDKANFNWGIGPLPAGPAGNYTLVSGLGDVIYSKTNNPEASWKLVKFMVSQQAQDILAESGIVFPGNKDSIPKFVDYYKQLGVNAQPFVEGYNGQTVVSPAAKNYNDWYQNFVKYTSIMMSGEMDPNTTLDKLKQEGDIAANQ
jgi:multiple sugar transport system substrate-binding protein